MCGADEVVCVMEWSGANKPNLILLFLCFRNSSSSSWRAATCWTCWFPSSSTWTMPERISVSHVSVHARACETININLYELSSLPVLKTKHFPCVRLQPGSASCTSASSSCCCWVEKETLASVWTSRTLSVCPWTFLCSQEPTPTCS